MADTSASFLWTFWSAEVCSQGRARCSGKHGLIQLRLSTLRLPGCGLLGILVYAYEHQWRLFSQSFKEQNGDRKRRPMVIFLRTRKRETRRTEIMNHFLIKHGRLARLSWNVTLLVVCIVGTRRRHVSFDTWKMHTAEHPHSSANAYASNSSLSSLSLSLRYLTETSNARIT